MTDKCPQEKIQKCSLDNKLCNPSTGRCVKKDGEIGKRLAPTVSKKKQNNSSKKLWDRLPKKSLIHRHMATWQNTGYGSLADARRFGRMDRFNPEFTMKLNYALIKHMKNSALRAPTLPVKATTKTLWRGLLVTPKEYKTIQKTKTWDDKSFMAFSRKQNVAMYSAEPMDDDELMEYEPFERQQYMGKTVGIVWQLDVNDVQQGTPWIWFADAESIRKTKLDWYYNNNPNTEDYESRPQHELLNKSWTPSAKIGRVLSETLLPPGTLYVTGPMTQNAVSGIHIIKVKYIPHAKLQSLYMNPYTHKPNVTIDLKKTHLLQDNESYYQQIFE